MRRDDFEQPRPPHIDRPSDRWRCDGGECRNGPSPDGQCGHTGPACSPQLTWRYRRRRWVAAGVAISLAAWTLVLAGSWHSNFVRPGRLIQPHAQILGSQLGSARCAACHPAANDSLLEWFSSADSGHQGVTQSQLCMDCHHTTLPKDRATMAHNLTANELQLIAAGRSQQQSSWRDSLPGPAVDIEQVHCAACHREHRGMDANLTLMTNGQCQTCHQDRFQSFAADHPDWQAWPYERGGVIAFDHATHYGKHFAATTDDEAAAFREDCRTCHDRTPAGEITRVVDYERSCAACHEDALRLEAGEGISLLAIPSLPRKPDRGIESWPEPALGFYDGSIGPLTRLLIHDQGQVSEALSLLSPESDLAKTDPNDAAQAAAADEVALAIVRLMDELAVQGHAAIVHRLRQQGVAEAVAREVAQQLSPQLVYDARERWFGSTPRRLPVGSEQTARPRSTPQTVPSQPGHSGDRAGEPSFDDDLFPDNSILNDSLLEDPLAGDSLAGDPLLDEDFGMGDPLAPAAESGEQPLSVGDEPSDRYDREEIDVEALLTFGGWFQDNRRLAIRYRGSRHADPVLRSIIDVAVALPPGTPIRRELLSLRATASCRQCHQVDDQSSVIRWDGQLAGLETRRFTKFSHQPHLHLAVLKNCTHCHQIRDLDASQRDIRLAASHEEDSKGDEFAPLTRQTCVACHTANAAGDRCTQCHHYHVAPMVTPSDSR